MSGTWSGFSEEDIKKLKSGNSKPETTTTDERKFIKVKRRVAGHAKNNNKNLVLKATPAVFEMPESAKLSTKNEDLLQKKANSAADGEKDIKTVEENLSKNSVTIDLSKIEKRVIDLDEFQARQKLIEEQNRKRKELLAKALADRTKQTEEEAKKLKEIQSEFKKLDALLSNDVSILRHQIEVASLEFMEAQKKYHRIEKDFLEAKLSLHQKLERKEMLTEHLCTIIEKNEERKAEKLSELMHRLEVDTKDVEAASPETKQENEENDVKMIDEVKNRREIKIDLKPEKNTNMEAEIQNDGE